MASSAAACGQPSRAGSALDSPRRCRRMREMSQPSAAGRRRCRRSVRRRARPTAAGRCDGARRDRRSRRGSREFCAGSRPSITFVPRRVVTGRSVAVRSVKHGTPRNVVSSWTPPESVRTAPHRLPARGTRGSRAAREADVRIALGRRRCAPRVRGCTGKTTGMRSATVCSCSSTDSRRSPSTSDGRCSVTSTNSLGRSSS